MDDQMRLPIIYVRGFAGGPRGIDEVTEDPFYGFNTGSTHARAGVEGDIIFYQFESPLLRLMIDHDYRLFVRGNQRTWLQEQKDGTVEDPTIWIHRFYDESAGTWGRERQPFRIEKAAEGLLDLIKLVRQKTGSPRVHLVAHSMGGLVCRCLIQKVLPDQREHATDYVDRLFTYATPHGGISFDVGFGLVEKLRDITGIFGADIFGPDRMREYLTPENARPHADDWTPHEIPDDVFPKERIFTLVGTNHEDYDVASGISAWAVGPKSDGLVQTDSAYIPGARFAFVHRSHGGRHGIVNSEAGYQNLRRFLFGHLEATADLINLHLPGGGERSWQADVEVSIRGQRILMHEQVARHLCPVVLKPFEEGADQPNPLVTTFLLADPVLRPEGRDENRYILHVRVFSLKEREDPSRTEGSGLIRFFNFRQHQEQIADFDDSLVVDLRTDDGRMTAWAQWASGLNSTLEDYQPTGDPLTDAESAEPGLWVSNIKLPDKGRSLFGEEAAIRLKVLPRLPV